MDAPVAVDEAMTLSRMLSTDESPKYLGELLRRIGDLWTRCAEPRSGGAHGMGRDPYAVSRARPALVA